VPSAISAISTTRTNEVIFQANSHVQFLQSARVSARYFDVLAIHPVLGRNFSEDEDLPHGPKAAILSYRLWRTVFDGKSGVLGQAILLKGEPYTIVGVLPEGATTPLNAEVYTPLQASREGEGQGTNFATILRLRDSATWQQANTEIDRVISRSSRVERFTKMGGRATYYAVPLQKGETDTLRPQVLAMMGAAGFILLIACANLAGLVLVRMLRRRGEIATRLALGASRLDMRDLMMPTLAAQKIEVALLSAMACLGLLLSAIGIFALVSNTVVQRTREIGIRMALGSTVGQAMVRIGRTGFGASLAGIAVGLTTSAGVLRLMRSAVFGVSVYDVPTLAGVAFALLLVSVLAIVIPMLKIASIDPAATLREK
jgi:ABC-type antimicrobial peptide transport system permease subunit